MKSVDIGGRMTVGLLVKLLTGILENENMENSDIFTRHNNNHDRLAGIIVATKRETGELVLILVDEEETEAAERQRAVDNLVKFDA